MIDKLTDPVRFWTKSWRDHRAGNPGMPGEASLALLQARAREKLDEADRERLAMGLYRETLRIARTAGTPWPFSNAAWMSAAGLADDPVNPTKRLNEYVLPPYAPIDSDAWRARAGRLSASARNYALLIEALAGFTHEDRGAVWRRIFAGSSFAVSEADTARYARLATRLQELIVQIDKLAGRTVAGASLTQAFVRTAEVKAALLRAGLPPAWWPYYGRHEAVAAGAALPDPYWDVEQNGPYGALNPSSPEYRYMSVLPLDWLDALIYLPRAYLGCATSVVDWIDEPDAAPELAGKLFATLHHHQSTLGELRSPVTGESRYRGAIALDACDLSPRAAERAGDRTLEEEEHCWIVIYPARGRSGLCPLLYWVRGETGVHICELNRFSMHALSQLHVPSEQGVFTLVERIEQLLAEPSHMLATEWARTAFDLHRNPVLVQQAKHDWQPRD